MPTFEEQTRRTLDAVRAILAIEDHALQQIAVSDFLRYRRREHFTVASNLLRGKVSNPVRYREDVMSIVAEEDFHMLELALADPGYVEKLKSWTGMLQSRCRNPVKMFLDSPGGAAPMSGMASMLRRRRELKNTRSKLAAAGDPAANDDRKVVEVTNQRLAASLADQVHQGMVCSLDDLYVQTQPIELFENEASAHDAGDFLLHPTEAPDVIEEIIRVATEKDYDLGLVADAWLGDLYGPDPGQQVRSVSEIASIVSMGYAEVHRRIEVIKEIAVLVIQRVAGITAEDYHGTGEGYSA